MLTAKRFSHGQEACAELEKTLQLAWRAVIVARTRDEFARNLYSPLAPANGVI
jgi:hypothetical protein